MSRKREDPDTIRIQLVFEKDGIYWDSINYLLDKYKTKTMSNSIKLALKDYKMLLENTKSDFSELFKIVSIFNNNKK